VPPPRLPHLRRMHGKRHANHAHPIGWDRAHRGRACVPSPRAGDRPPNGPKTGARRAPDGHQNARGAAPVERTPTRPLTARRRGSEPTSCVATSSQVSAPPARSGPERERHICALDLLHDLGQPAATSEYGTGVEGCLLKTMPGGHRLHGLQGWVVVRDRSRHLLENLVEGERGCLLV